MTLKEMTKQRQRGNGHAPAGVVLLSDGDDTSSLVSFDDVMELAKQSGISIYTIMLSSALDAQLRPAAGSELASKSEYGMKSLAQETGARSFPASDSRRSGWCLQIDRPGAGEPVRDRLHVDQSTP